MAAENLELVRSLYTEWQGGDYSSVEWADREIEFVIADGPSPSSSTGLTEMGERFNSILGAWEDWRSTPEEFRELDDERVLVLVEQSGRGRASGLEIDRIRTKGAVLYHVRGGKVTKIVLYFNRDYALSDLGL